MDVEKRNRGDVQPFVTKDGSMIREVLHPSNSPVQNLSLAEATVAPGQRTRGHLHERSEEAYYIMEGRGTVKVGDETREVSPGDGILIPPGTSHWIENTGDVDLVLLCLCAPPYSHEDTIL